MRCCCYDNLINIEYVPLIAFEELVVLEYSILHF